MITKDKLATLQQTIRDQYAEQIRAMAKTKDRPMGIPKKTIEDLIAGHDDGVRNTIAALVTQGLIKVGP